QALAKQIEELRERFTDVPEHGSDCLCRVATELNTDDVVKACGEMFEETSGWIEGVYDLENVRTFYGGLASAVKVLRPGVDLRLLDVGCGTALGANELLNYDVSYWGVDISE